MVYDPAPALRKTEMQQANQFYVVFVKSSINGQGQSFIDWVTLSIRTPKTRVSHEAAQKAVFKHFVRLASFRNV